MNARVPADEGVAHLDGERAAGVVGTAAEDVVAQPAAELRAHRALPRVRAEDDAHGLLELPFAADQGDAALRVHAQRERPPGADEVLVHLVSSCLASCFPCWAYVRCGPVS